MKKISGIYINGAAGFTLIEVLAALLIIIVGLLGIASLQMKSQQMQIESFQRAQALVMLEDMVNRINANRNGANCYAITTDSTGAPYAGTDSALSDCVAAINPTYLTLANTDLAAWDAMLKGAGEARGGLQTGAMIGARGCIVSPDPDITPADANTYRVTIAWQGLSDTVAPTNTCAKGQYGGSDGEKRRRVVSATVKIAQLN